MPDVPRGGRTKERWFPGHSSWHSRTLIRQVCKEDMPPGAIVTIEGFLAKHGTKDRQRQHGPRGGRVLFAARTTAETRPRAFKDLGTAFSRTCLRPPEADTTSS